MHLGNPDEIINIELFHQAEFGFRDLFLEIQKHRLERVFLISKAAYCAKEKNFESSFYLEAEK